METETWEKDGHTYTRGTIGVPMPQVRKFRCSMGHEWHGYPPGGGGLLIISIETERTVQCCLRCFMDFAERNFGKVEEVTEQADAPIIRDKVVP